MLGLGFLLGFSSASASSGGGSGSKVPRSYSFIYVLALSNPHLCSMLCANTPILHDVVSIRLKLLVSSALWRGHL